MVEIHIYGRLRRYAGDLQPRPNGVLRLETRPGDTIASLLARMGIPVEEINHIFYNAKLLATRSRVARLFDYPQSDANPFDWDLGVPVGDGDRIGLFGTDMALLGM